MLTEIQKNKNINDSLLKCLDREQKEREISIKFGLFFTKKFIQRAR